MVTDPLEESKHREETQAAESELSDNAHAYFTDNALGDQIGGNFADERIQNLQTAEKNKVDFYHPEKNKIFNKQKTDIESQFFETLATNFNKKKKINLKSNKKGRNDMRHV